MDFTLMGNWTVKEGFSLNQEMFMMGILIMVNSKDQDYITTILNRNHPMEFLMAVKL